MIFGKKTEKETIKKKFKQYEHVKLEKLYQMMGGHIEASMRSTHQAIVALLENNHSEFVKYKKRTIDFERDSDTIHDYVIVRLFGKEVLVFSRPDRLFMINEIDNIVDGAERIVRNAAIYQPEHFPNSLVIRLIGLTEKNKIMGGLLKDAITLLFTDFNSCLTTIKSIEKIRRESRKDYMKFLENTYLEKDLSAQELMYYDRLVRDIWASISKINKFSDGLRRIIFKYRI